MAWIAILAYVCFAIGGVLLLLGSVRVTHFFCTLKKYRQGALAAQSVDDTRGLTLKKDPWLLNNPNTAARINTGNEDVPENLNEVDVNNAPPDPPPVVEREASLTESQQECRLSTELKHNEECVEVTYHTIPSEYIITRTRVKSDESGRPVLDASLSVSSTEETQQSPTSEEPPVRSVTFTDTNDLQPGGTVSSGDVKNFMSDSAAQLSLVFDAILNDDQESEDSNNGQMSNATVSSHLTSSNTEEDLDQATEPVYGRVSLGYVQGQTRL